VPNPNNCSTCKHKQCPGPDDHPDQWCYMFADEPIEVCMQHTGRKTEGVDVDFPVEEVWCRFSEFLENARMTRPTLVRCYAIKAYAQLPAVIDSCWSQGPNPDPGGLLHLYQHDPIRVTKAWMKFWDVHQDSLLVKWPSGFWTVRSQSSFNRDFEHVAGDIYRTMLRPLFYQR